MTFPPREYPKHDMSSNTAIYARSGAPRPRPGRLPRIASSGTCAKLCLAAAGSIMSTVVGFPVRDSHFSVCADLPEHAVCPAVAGIRSGRRRPCTALSLTAAGRHRLITGTILPDKVMAHPDRGGTSPPPSALHEESGRNLSEVADDLTISTSKLSRLENAQGRPQPRDVRDLIRYYGIEDAPLDVSLRRWVNAAQRQGGWTDVDDELLGEQARPGHALALRSGCHPWSASTTCRSCRPCCRQPSTQRRSSETWKVVRKYEIAQLLEVRARRSLIPQRGVWRLTRDPYFG